MGGYGHLEACRFGDLHTWKWTGGALSGSNMEDPNGYIGCDWSSPGTAGIDSQATGDFAVDSISFANSGGITFTGSAVFVGAPYKGLSNPAYPMPADFAATSVSQQNMKNALDRLASAVQGLLGGPIP